MGAYQGSKSSISGMYITQSGINHELHVLAMMRHPTIADNFSKYILLFVCCCQFLFGLRAPPNMDPLAVIQHPNCRSYTFSSTKRLHGVFKSPNYPSSYPPETECIVYLFQGLPSQIVQISFLTVNLSPPRMDVCFDYVAILPSNISSLMNLASASNSNSPQHYVEAPTVICGSLSMQKRKTFYSENNTLLLVFHTSTRSSLEKSALMSGFQGNFLFLNSTNFRVDGDRLPNTKCSYAIRNTSSRRFVTGGRIVSPRFPNNYPPNIRCTYTFMGRSDDRVVMSITSLRLSHRDLSNPTNSTDKSCIFETVPESSFDRILVHTLPHDSWRDSILLSRICGTLSSFQVISNGPNLMLTFLSLPFRPKEGGYLIEFAFVKKSTVSPQVQSTTDGVIFEQGALRESVKEIYEYLHNVQKVNHPEDEAERENSHGSGNANIFNSDSAISQQTCNAPEIFDSIIDSNNAEEGVITSPNFPDIYPKCVNAKFYFRGRSGQRVFLKFVLLELGDHEQCNEGNGDRLSFYDGPSTDMSVHMSVCGSRHSVFQPKESGHSSPAQYFSIASSGNHFAMLFTSDEFVGKYEFGFRLEYKFQNVLRLLCL
ncbi:unnamed protein product [Hymenolepis diminuta]|uniref:CUB domain-containing protein n=1 Tax=Hymenolepis diminuta TaxID=6216 RepID=A0A158QDC0_HYMDI|nr:unnamed protein product [Hymenolepis diminuta]